MFTAYARTITKVVYPKKNADEVLFKFDDRSEWCGAKLKDFWRNKPWKNIIRRGSELRLWMVQGSTVVGFECWDEERQLWEPVWCATNDFEEEAKSRKRR
jgi:hypothetical protein